MYSKNEILVYDDYCKIIIRNKHGRCIGQAIIDREDYFKVTNIKWTITNTGYATGHNPETNQTVLLHNHLITRKKGLVVDHINRNKMDNRKENLRLVTYSENMMNRFLDKRNTSGATGVYWYKNRKRWVAEMRYEKQRFYCGSSEDFTEAVKMRQEKEIELLGKIIEY